MWRKGPAPDLGTGDAHIWRVELDLSSAAIEHSRSLLSQEESARENRFHFERDRRRYAVARGSLRKILARYVGLDAAELRFCYGAHGKPYLAPEWNSIGLQFNVSHSNELALVAVCLAEPIGVDIEFKNVDRA